MQKFTNTSIKNKHKATEHREDDAAKNTMQCNETVGFENYRETLVAKSTDAPAFNLNALYAPVNDSEFENYIGSGFYSDTQEDIEKNFKKPPAAITTPKKKRKAEDKRLKNNSGELINVTKTKNDIAEAMESVAAAEHIFQAAIEKAKKTLNDAKTTVEKLASSLPAKNTNNKPTQNVEIVAIDDVA